MVRWKKLDLELSLKPFVDRSHAGIERMAETICRQWEPLIAESERVSLMFWAADGSEILDYNGEMNDSFEWAKWIGVANPHGAPSGLPPELQGIHEHPRLYREGELKDWTYGEFRELMAILRSVFRRRFGRELRIGATFDSGPEFALSSFKYQRHPEVCRGFCLGGKTFVCCYTALHADDRAYAAYPSGIPEGEPFGRFLGKQSQKYLTDMGFDYIWFSNGFGFGMETWGATGAIFDGLEFYPEKADEVRRAMYDFWRNFRRECPDFPVETRGTNLSTGMDLSSDATPLREIYRESGDLEVSPNSPWAALNGDFGMELAGWMSHIAELPAGKGYPFRFYIHDIWFMNSPWLDRYGRSPHDIYLPMAVARLDGAGRVQLPDALHMLSIDDSYGRMPDQVPNEVIPHIQDMRRTASDQAGPLVWIYPFDEYHDLVYAGDRLEEVFAGDYFIRGAINCGLPLNTVISTGNFLSAPDACFRDRILVLPTVVTVNDAVMTRLDAFLKSGGNVLLYGPAHGGAVERLLGLVSATPLDGEFTVAGFGKMKHLSRYSGGELNRVFAPETPVKTLLEYRQNGECRPAAARISRPEWGKGSVVWVRGTNSFSMGKDQHFTSAFERSEYAYGEALARQALAEFGYAMEFDRFDAATPEPRLTLRYHANALYLAAFGTDTTVTMRMRFPDGAPLFTGMDTLIHNGFACYPAERAVNRECRFFLTAKDGKVDCREHISLMPGVKRRMRLSGLCDARIVFRPEPEHVKSVRFGSGAYDGTKRTLLEPSLFESRLEYDGFGPKYILEHITGDLLVSWGEEN